MSITSARIRLYLDMSTTSNRVIRAVAGAGPLLFFAIATIEGSVRAGYDPISQPISALAIGDRGWIQGINFGILALSLLAMGAVLRVELRASSASRAAPFVGFASRAAPLVFLVMSIGVALAGIFPMDALGAPPTRAGELHMAAGFLVFPWIPVAILLVAARFRRDSHWRPYFVPTALTGLFCLVTIVFFLVFVGPPGFARPLPGLVGLVQRVDLFAFFTWIAFVAHHATLGNREPSTASRADWRGSPSTPRSLDRES